MNKLLSNNMGFKAEHLVKRRLWAHGYSVKHTIGGPYDLLVNGKTPVEVKSSKYYLSKRGGYEWRLSQLYATKPWEVLATVLYMPIGNPLVFYFTRDEILEKYAKFEKAFDGRDIVVLPSITLRASEGSELNFGESNPAKIFGEPARGDK